VSSATRKASQRCRQGSGCVYRPAYKIAGGETRYGRWRIKFIYTDPQTGEKRKIDELVEHATSQQGATEYLKR
jgi:hypothetical protein